MANNTIIKNVKLINNIKYAQCTKCKEWFPETEEYFELMKTRVKKYFRAQCKQCIAKYKKAYNKKYRNQKKYENTKDYRLKNGKFKKCSQCKNYFPATKKYFYWYETTGIFATWCVDCAKKYSQEYDKNRRDKEAKRKRTKRWYERTKDRDKPKRSKYHKKHGVSKVIFQTYAPQLTIEECAKDDCEGNLLVKCAYCGRYYYPTNRNVMARVQALKGNMEGECRLYCSEGCKTACPIYNVKIWPRGFKPASSREVDPLIRQMCLARDNYECQRCGVSIEKVELHAHHIEGATQQPMLSNDVDNTITLCKPCHKWVHRQKGCTTYDLRCNK